MIICNINFSGILFGYLLGNGNNFCQKCSRKKMPNMPRMPQKIAINGMSRITNVLTF